MKLMRRLSVVTTTGVVAFSAVLSVWFPGVTYAVANTCTWTGTAGDSKFSTATNWTGCNSTAPQTGDIIKLPYVSTSPTLVNDLPAGTLLAGLTIDTKDTSTSSTSFYTVDTFAFANGAVINRVSGMGVAISDSVTAAGTLSTNTMYPFSAVTKNVTLTLTDLTLSSVTPYCGGNFGATPEFTFSIRPTGTVEVNSGNVYDAVGTESTIVVAAGATVSLPSGAYAGDITFIGGGTTQGICDRGYSMNAYVDSTLSGGIVLMGGDIGYNIAAGKTLTLTGSVAGANAKLFGHVNSAGTFVNNAATNSSATPSGSQTVAVKELAAITDDKAEDNLEVKSNEIVALDGVRAYVTVFAKAVLRGTGTVKGGLYVADGGTVAPGHSPGCLTSETLSLYGTYLFELGGTEACTGYDQLKVLNAANTPNAVTLDNATTVLTTSRYNDFTPAQGDIFVIIDQGGNKAVGGTFKDLPEGATFEQNGIVFMISYVGGDGNDVSLTVQNTPTAPDTGMIFASSNPLVVLALLTALSGGIVLVARRMRTAKTNR